MSLEIDVVEYFFCLLESGLQLGCNFFSIEKIVVVAEDLKLVFEVADLVVAEAREGLEFARSQYFVSHLIKMIFET